MRSSRSIGRTHANVPANAVDEHREAVVRGAALSFREGLAEALDPGVDPHVSRANAGRIIMDAHILSSRAMAGRNRSYRGRMNRRMALTLRLNGPIIGARGCNWQLLSVCFLISLLCGPLCGIDRDRRLDELHHTSWTNKEGAPSEIFVIAQTEDGYLWLGTTTELARFEGIHFENYESPFGQALPAKNVSSLLAVPDGGLWIGFSSGEVSLLKNGRITTYSQKDGLPPSSVRSLVRDRQGRIWAASLTGLSQFNGSRWRSIGADWDFSGGATAAFVDHVGTIWIGSQDRVAFLPEGARRFQLAVDAGHWGWPGIRERAKLAGAQLEFWSDVETGTEVQVTVPESVAYAKAREARVFGLFRKAWTSHGQ